MPEALPYKEPALVHLFIFLSFAYLLNVTRSVTDFLFHGGVVAEIILGILYGDPLSGLLPREWETAFTVLGYTGLLLVIFEGGLSSNLPMLLSNLPLSTICALTGIGLPIAFSIALLHGAFGYSPLEAFAAGAALSSTSLGTTLAVLNSVRHTAPHHLESPSTSTGTNTASTSSSSDVGGPSLISRDEVTATIGEHPNSLGQSRIGTILISAAIIDDVVGLVIAAVIPALASAESVSSHIDKGELAWTITRPLLSSLLIAVIAPLVSCFVLRPLFWYKGFGELWCAPARADKPWGMYAFAKPENGWGTEEHADAVKVFVMIAALSAMAAISNYSNTQSHGESGSAPSRAARNRRSKDLSFEDAFGRIIGPIQQCILLPLFFASIGFAIPFLDLWRPIVIWRGILYSVFMCLAKLAVGLPILIYGPLMSYVPSVLGKTKRSVSSSVFKTKSAILRRVHWLSISRPSATPDTGPEGTATQTPEKADAGTTSQLVQSASSAETRSSTSPSPQDGLGDIRAATFMGVAMVARGEIGLLIAQLARGDPGKGQLGLLGEETFLLCIWAILLCTLVGPMCLGYIVRRWG
ncbi:hypothetical protein ONZ51_g10708 [Trametes cubensis]|uniref:Cation/H+ exchanger transmembrane domain-containing protein n=1 Tax=Trametes cubensis TaxID=1111947 RepID=A0AAD7TKN2_9APHY|nr:hypothetical protein ONZ51_g10708 [Trametes cubensis]